VSTQSQLSLDLTPWDAGFSGVALDGSVQVAQILQIFNPPAEALEFGMELANGGTVGFAFFLGPIHRLLFDALQHTRR
jgi:hypothetical protein